MMKEEVLAWVLGALVALGSAAAQSTLMPTEVQSFDGNQRDLAVSHADVTTIDPAAERLLLAQGRRLPEHVVSTRERQFGLLDDLLKAGSASSAYGTSATGTAGLTATSCSVALSSTA